MRWFVPLMALIFATLLLGIAHSSLAAKDNINHQSSDARSIASGHSSRMSTPSPARVKYQLNNQLIDRSQKRQKKFNCSLSGKYKHFGFDKHTVRSQASTACFEAELSLYEHNRGQLPNDDQAQTIIETCVNQTTCS